MRVFSIVGVSKSGKTTVAEAVIAELRRRNYSVGSVKDIHFEGFAIDQEGTNTHRHKMAGAELVTARGLHETDILFQSRLSLPDILRFYDQDFVILEGAYDFKGPGLITACVETEIDERWWDNVIAVTGRIAGRLCEYKGLTVINALTDVVGLTDLIEQTVMPWNGQTDWIRLDDVNMREMLPSKKNHIYREQTGRQEVVVKQITDPGRFQMEKEIGTLLQETDLATPRRLAVNNQEQKIIYAYIPAVPLVDIIETEDLDKLYTVFTRMSVWMMKFYTIIREKADKQYILGDVHLRNFIYDDREGVVYGVDFEECRPGRIETDVARLYTFILHYEPAFTPRKKALADYLLKKFAALTELNEDFLQSEIERETAELLLRRRRIPTDNPSAG